MKRIEVGPYALAVDRLNGYEIMALRDMLSPLADSAPSTQVTDAVYLKIVERHLAQRRTPPTRETVNRNPLLRRNDVQLEAIVATDNTPETWNMSTVTERQDYINHPTSFICSVRPRDS